ncbi:MULTISPECIES: OmpA family protein [unclassified Pseudomonas]|uniref:flagellar protein MotY n=1 Tax=unclassified Pseudomonas TaxID=196821 RepID=UPI000D385CA0|nr:MULTISPECIES: OmpA family protein [unclassified Pseudomonas]RAU43317.1 OmpA family protein [Pseudomonas sp. RIT 409]RAU50360.1 OmpA family protein [Pseudomonas sp. RIT 412]
MRQRYLALLSVFASLPAMALTFQTRLENIEWKVEGDQFECRLSQPIADFGAGEFVRRAGEQATFRLKATGYSLASGSATLIAAAAPWQPGRGDLNLGAVKISGGDIPFNTSQAQAGRLIAGLMDGRTPVIRHALREGGAMEVRLLPVRFSKAYSDFQVCTAKLLPMNFDQVRQTEVGFPGGGIDLDASAKRRLDTVLAYMKADPTVNRVELDGHSDNSGNRLTNRDLSRRRALAVMDYLKAQGVPEEQIIVRFHGEQYPLVPNTNNTNRARNRRVNIHLDRVAEQKPFVPPVTAPAPATTPAPAAPAAPATAAGAASAKVS